MVQQFVRRRVQCRNNDPGVLIQLCAFRPQKVALDVHPVQSIVNPAHNIVVSHVRSVLRADREPVQSGQRFVADQDRRAVSFFQIHQMRRMFGKFPANLFRLPVGGVLLKIVAQKPFPVSFDRIVQGMPVPVHNTVGSRRQMTVGLQAQLSGIGKPFGEPLRLRLQHQIIVPFQRAGHIAAESDLRPGQSVLRRVVNIHTGDGQRTRRMKMVDTGLHAIGMSAPVEIKILCHKLVVSAILSDDLCLPRKEPVHQSALVLLELRAQAAVDRPPHIGKILPRIDPVAPVIQTEFVIQRIQIVVELFAQVFHESLLHIFSGGSVVLRLIVQLKADHARPVCRVFHQFPNHPFRIEQVDWVRDIHDLAGSVNSPPLFRGRQHLRIRFHHPGRHRVSRRPDDHRDSRLLHRIHHSLHMREIKHSILRLAGAPGRLRDPHHVDPCRFHHLHVLLQTIHRKILLIIRCSIK